MRFPHFQGWTTRGWNATSVETRIVGIPTSTYIYNKWSRLVSWWNLLLEWRLMFSKRVIGHCCMTFSLLIARILHHRTIPLFCVFFVVRFLVAAPFKSLKKSGKPSDVEMEMLGFWLLAPAKKWRPRVPSRSTWPTRNRSASDEAPSVDLISEALKVDSLALWPL